MTIFSLHRWFNSNHAAGLLFWGSLALLLYVYLGYPLPLALISRFVPKRRAALGYEPFITVLIAAHNEEPNIRAKIEQTLNLDYPASKLEVLVVSDGSTDNTNEIVNSLTD